ncbi:MAG: FadR family transcriptional regulator [Saccharopolyspora sp.]|uniref:FadR/GntR family transcriptional regulator n=1 Tax=Saccharopolyspora sp. TaxID=33915 RepID=UPI0025EB7AE1|nr:GntR family transcriptional regulator [Saccharopolyspora sp.]MBQ6642215.1 FadR family transcriptional regulator [Saccharopolyspora sp.]
MPTVFREVNRSRLYEQVLAQLREHIAAEGLRTGDRLPPERRLAELLGVSRASVKQAVVALESEGVVQVCHGNGTYLRTDLDAAGAQPRTDRDAAETAVEAHRALEVKLAELAARNRGDSDLASLDPAATANGQGILEHFHETVREAAHNPLLADFAREAAEYAESPTCEPRSGSAAAEHARIAEAIAAGHAHTAGLEMARHLNASAH